MRRQLFFVLIIVSAVVFIFTGNAFAQRGLRPRKADRNKDGIVDRKEQRIKKQKEEKLQEKIKKVNTWWEKRADTNNDGTVDPDELAAWKKLQKERIDLNGDGVIDPKERRLCWRHAKSKVNTPLERKHDINSNGFLEPNEVKTMLQETAKDIASNGIAPANSDILKEYDINSNGMIDQKEGELIKEDIK